MDNADFNVMGISHCSTVDGPGLRTVIWFQGCKNHCKGCHNPDSWDTEKQCTLCSLYALCEDSAPNKLEDGITLSGGDPLWQPDLYRLAQFIHMYHNFHEKKSIWMYTGLKFENLKKHIKRWVKNNPTIHNNIHGEYSEWLYTYLFEFVDVLVDGPFIEELKTDKCIYRGSSNQRLVNMKESVEQKKLILFDPDSIQI